MNTTDMLKGFFIRPATEMARMMGFGDAAAEKAASMIEKVAPVISAMDRDILAADRARLDGDELKLVAIARGHRFEEAAMSPALQVAAQFV